MEYQSLLDNLILKYYEERNFLSSPILENEDINKSNSYSLGTDTPHFIFNFIDYLYWVDNRNPTSINTEYEIKDFDFKYWNSVEHHMAQEWAERNIDQVPDKDNYIDCLGNLCLRRIGLEARGPGHLFCLELFLSALQVHATRKIEIIVMGEKKSKCFATSVFSPTMRLSLLSSVLQAVRGQVVLPVVPSSKSVPELCQTDWKRMRLWWNLRPA